MIIRVTNPFGPEDRLYVGQKGLVREVTPNGQYRVYLMRETRTEGQPREVLLHPESCERVVTVGTFIGDLARISDILALAALVALGIAWHWTW